MPTIKKIDVTQSLGNLHRRVRPNLRENVELKTMDCFRCVPPHDLGYLGPASNLPDAQISYPKTGITRPTDSFYTRLRSDWM